MSRRTGREIPLEGRVRDTERWPTNISWPAPIDQRLDALRNLAIDAGESTSLSRAELLAALVAAAEPDGAALRGALERYRLASVRDIALNTEDEDVIILSQRRPGRR